MMRGLLPLVLLAVGCGVHRGPLTSSPLPPYEEPSVTCDADAEGTITGIVRHQVTDEPLGSALILLQSSSIRGTMEVSTDSYGRYRFKGLPPGTYTVQVLVGQADVSKVVTLPESARFSANFTVDPDDDFIACRLRPMVYVPPDQSLFSITDESEADMLQVPRTLRKY